MEMDSKGWGKVRTRRRAQDSPALSIYKEPLRETNYEEIYAFAHGKLDSTAIHHSTIRRRIAASGFGISLRAS